MFWTPLPLYVLLTNCIQSFVYFFTRTLTHLPNESCHENTPYIITHVVSSGFAVSKFYVASSLSRCHQLICWLLSGTNICTGTEVAIKLECIRTRHPQLHIESKIYKIMQGGCKCRTTLIIIYFPISFVYVNLKFLLFVFKLCKSFYTPQAQMRWYSSDSFSCSVN